MGLHGRNSIQLCTVPPVTVVHGRFYDAADASYARRLETVVEFILASLREDENNEDIPRGGLVSSFLLDK